MADVTSSPQASTALPNPDIYVIPEKYYGAVIRGRMSTDGEKGKDDVNAIVQPSRNAAVPYIVLATVVLLVGSGGAFVYFNKDRFFPKPAPAVVVEPPAPTPEAPPAPAAATNLTATSTNPQSALLAWGDAASNESGFRVERSDDTGTYRSLTNLPPNSTSFLDVAVMPGKEYKYRIFAVNEGGDSPASNESSAMVPLPPPPAPVQPTLPPAGLDADADGLTDAEEKIMGSDTTGPDTDADGFLDGNEVFNLYNPKGLAPGRLLDAGLVKTVNGTIGWSMQIPTSWNFSNDSSTDGTSSTIEIGATEKFHLAIESNPRRLSLVDWYIAGHPEVKVEQLRKYLSKKGYEGILGPDLLSTYIAWGEQIFVFTYELKGQPFINYRTLYAMMLNSVVLNGVAQSSNQTSTGPLPFEPAAKEPGVVTQPVAIPSNP